MLYAESSAVLAWLLDEPGGDVVRGTLEHARGIVASALTLIECDRALHRLAHGPEEVEVVAIGARLAETALTWEIAAISATVVERARQAFPQEPLRSLDAIHLASAIAARAATGDVDVLSLDGRIRANAEALGFRVLPA